MTGRVAVGREEMALRANKRLPSPSSYGKPGKGGWTDRKLRDLQSCMCFHRSALNSDKQPTLVVLMDPILAQVSHDCEYAIPTDTDCKFATLVASRMSNAFANEDDRMHAFWDLLEHAFHVSFDRAVYAKAETDGSFMHLGGLLVNIEVKNEVGSGGGAIHVQSAAYAAAHAFQASKIRRNCVCPTLLIELAGPNMSLSGAVLADMALWDQLTPMVSLLWQPHSHLMLQAARCFAAIRRAFPQLRSFYEAMDQQDREHQAPQRQLEYPYSTSFAGPQGRAISLYYEQKISSTCFKATLDNQEGHVLVKYCKSYSVEAHTCLASSGFAPNYVGMASLTNEWIMVVMEYVDGCLWDDAAEKPLAALQDAVQLLHKAGFVHRDFRSNNIMVVSSGVRLNSTANTSCRCK